MVEQQEINMRLWSIHPAYLDRAGLIACWRESLLAQAVLAGKTKGYKNHPQLIRFKGTKYPQDAIGTYLLELWFEAEYRGYNFDASKICNHHSVTLPVTTEQLDFEFDHLLAKVVNRNPEWYTYIVNKINGQEKIIPHPMFYVIDGIKEDWEKG